MENFLASRPEVYPNLSENTQKKNRKRQRTTGTTKN